MKPHRSNGCARMCVVHATQRHFVQSLRSGLPSETEAVHHLRRVEIIEAAHASAATGRAVTLS